MYASGFRHPLTVLLLLSAFVLSNAAPLVVAGLFPQQPSTRQTSLAAVPHAERCHCLHCPGGRACCCTPTHDAGAAVAMRAACEHPEDGLPASAHVVCILPSALCLPLRMARAALAPTRYACSIPHATLDTPFLPPRRL